MLEQPAADSLDHGSERPDPTIHGIKGLWLTHDTY